jgi:AraC-like DNA-binding protein
MPAPADPAADAHGGGLASVVHVLARLFALHGLDSARLAAHAGVVMPTDGLHHERVPVHKLDAMLSAATREIADPAFGLQAARCWHPSNFGVLGHAWLVSATLRAALDNAARYYRLVGERGSIDLVAEPRGVRVRFWARRGNPAAVPVAATVVDIAMALLLDMCRFNAGAALRPVAVTLRRLQPPNTDAYQRFFGCRVSFGAEENAFVLSPADATSPLPSSNRKLAGMFDHLLMQELASIDRSDIVALCRAELLPHLASARISAASTARSLHTTPRTLQRRLAAAGTSYAQVLDDVRHDVALALIDNGQLPITDITFALGFAEPSSFTRAFKRWTGVSPLQYRQRA